MRTVHQGYSRLVPGIRKRRGRIGTTMSAIVLTVVLLVASGPIAASAQGREIRDGEITIAIEGELTTSDAVEGHLIDVSTEDGIVTLEGTVDHLLARDQALRIARSHKGVRAVIDELTVRPVDRPDYEIRQDAVLAMSMDPAAESYQIEIDVEDGVVTLRGEVESMAEKRIAEKAVKKVRGIREIVDFIRVEQDENRPDDEIRNEIERRFELDPYISEWLVDVEVEDGEVRLEGTVGSSEEMMRIYGEAWVSGVEDVDAGGLDVEWWAEDRLKRDRESRFREDEEIEKALQDALLYDEAVTSGSITVAVEDGVATLTGKVGSLREKISAGEDARKTIGVYQVVNNLRVRPEGGAEVDDSKIEERVQRALKMSPVLERYELEAVSRNGKVYLYGQVDSYYEYDQALRLASDIKGVIDVASRLKVEYSNEDVRDRMIEDRIEKEFMWNPYVDSEDLEVEVEDAVATLKGKVDNWRQYQETMDAAFRGGAFAVESELIFEYSGEKRQPYRGVIRRSHRYLW